MRGSPTPQYAPASSLHRLHVRLCAHPPASPGSGVHLSGLAEHLCGARAESGPWASREDTASLSPRPQADVLTCGPAWPPHLAPSRRAEAALPSLPSF